MSTTPGPYFGPSNTAPPDPPENPYEDLECDACGADLSGTGPLILAYLETELGFFCSIECHREFKG